jgi:ketosteroid isomerase-like protein
MSQENVELVGRWFESFDSDSDAFRDTLHPEIEWFPFEENHTPTCGIDGALRIRNQWLDAWDTLDYDLEEVVDEGDSVVASAHVMNRGKLSGVEVDVRIHFHFKVRDGKIVYLFEHMDRVAALGAAGLSEQDAHADS